MRVTVCVAALQGAGAGGAGGPHYDKLEQPEQPAASPYSPLVLGADLYADQSAAINFEL